MIADRFCVGLTGGIACGKSAAAAIFIELGGKVLDADVVIHRLYEPGGAGAEAASSLAGPEILDTKGRVDRPRLAEIVYRDQSFRRELERRVHPLVRKELEHWVEALPTETLPFFSAALLVETGFCDRFPAVVCVTCSQSRQLARLRMRDPGLSYSDAKQRIEAQMPIDRKKQRCPSLLLLPNDGSLADLRTRASLLYEELSRRQQSAGTG